MGKRGPKSATELMMIEAGIANGTIKLGQRPEPPAILNDRAADEWRKITNAMPSDWFTDETLAILQIHCEHVAESDALQLMIERVRRKAMTNDECFDRYKTLMKMKEAQTRAVAMTATKLRITHQSTYTNQTARTGKRHRDAASRPWEE